MWINFNMLFWIIAPIAVMLIILDRARQIKNGQPRRQYSEKTLIRIKKFCTIACWFMGVIIILMILQLFFITHTFISGLGPSDIAILLFIYILYAHFITFQLMLFPFFQENLRPYKRCLLVLLGVLPWLLFGTAVCLSEEKTGKEKFWQYLLPSITFWILNFPSIFLSKPWMKYYMDYFNAGIDYCANTVLKFYNRKTHE